MSPYASHVGREVGFTAGRKNPIALEARGAVVNFADILSIGDPVVNGVIENTVTARLANIPHRQFRLTPKALVLLFDSPYTVAISDALHKIEHDLSTSHCGRLGWKIHDLRGNMAQFRAECRAVIEGENLRPSQASYRAASDQLGTLLHIIDALHTVDLAAHLRRQPVVRALRGAEPVLEFEEWSIGLDELETAIGMRIRDEPWKFQHVTEFVDFRVLEQILGRWAGDHPVSLNFHVHNILLPRFNEMAKSIARDVRNFVIFELAASQFMDQRAEFVEAAGKLRGEGFRIALDGAMWPVVESMTDAFAYVQYVKIPWSDAFAQVNDVQKDRIKAFVADRPALAFILCRCSRPEDLTVGQGLGFSIFEGWSVAAPGAAVPA